MVASTSPKRSVRSLKFAAYAALLLALGNAPYAFALGHMSAPHEGWPLILLVVWPSFAAIAMAGWAFHFYEREQPRRILLAACLALLAALIAIPTSWLMVALGAILL